MPENATLALFVPHVGTSFNAAATPQTEPCALRLIEAEPLSRASALAPEVETRFSLVFRGPPSHVLTQQIYLLQHAALGELPLFLVPVGASADGNEYQAIINNPPRGEA